MPPSPMLRTAACVLSALSLASALGCSARNVVGELPDGGRAGAGGGLAATAGTGGGTIVASCGTVPVTSQIPRLTNAQYDRTVRDLLGVTTLTARGVAPSALLADDSPAPLTDLAWNGYWAAAGDIAAQVMADPALRTRFIACTPAGDGTACLHDTIISFGRRAFRRPLTAAEVARFDKIVAAGARNTATGAPLEVAEVLLEAFLVSPSFIQRSEISSTLPDGQGHYSLSPYEVASRLAFMLWGSVPDDILNAAADADQLGTKEQVRAQAVRMLADSRARELVAAFHRSYLEMNFSGGPWDRTTTKDPVRFPAYTSTFGEAARTEVERFFDALTFDKKGSFQSLLTSPLGFVTRETASTYGLDPSRYGATLTEATLNATQRPGFLTRIGFLSAFSSYTATSPIRRGGFVTRQVLGAGSLLTPVVVGGSEPTGPGQLLTNRAAVEAVTGGDECAPCHNTYINPPGFVLEAYNAIGAWQTNEADTGAPIDTKADVMIDGQPVTVRDPAELMTLLAASTSAQHAYASSLVSFAYERDSALDACTVDTLATSIASSSAYRIVDLFVDLTQSEAFRLRAREVTP